MPRPTSRPRHGRFDPLARRSELLHEAQLSDVGAAEFRCSLLAVRAIPGRGVKGDRPLVLFVGEQERLPAAVGAKRIMGCGEQRAADPTSAVFGMNEEQEHLAVVRVDSGVSNDAIGPVVRDQERVWRPVVGNQLVPVLGREHRLIYELAQVCPAGTDGGVEDRPNRRRVCRNGRPYGNWRPGPVVHATPPIKAVLRSCIAIPPSVFRDRPKQCSGLLAI